MRNLRRATGTPSTTGSGPTHTYDRAVTLSRPARRKFNAISWAISCLACLRAIRRGNIAMQSGLTETQQNVKNTTRKFLSAECPLADVRRLMETDTAHDAALWKKMAGQGWTGIIFPEEYDGFGMGMVEMAAALEEMGRALLPGPFLSTVLLAGAAIDSAGDHEAKRRWLIPICKGEACSTLALLEDSASWSVDAVQL